METLESAKQKLADAIGSRVSERKHAEIFLALNCIKCSQEEVLEALSENFGDAATCARNIVRLVEAKVDRDTFLSANASMLNYEELRWEFENWEKVFYAQLGWLTEYVAVNARTVSEHYTELRRQKRQSRNDKEWTKTLATFAAEQFVGIDLQQLISKLSLQVELFISERNLNDVPGRFAWQAFAIEDSNQRSDNQDSDGFSGDGYEYEHHIASLIAKAVPDARVEVTKASGDQGADVIFELDRFKIVIQTKLYSGSVGNDAVQQVYAAKRFYAATAAMVVTNSSYTASAVELAESLQVLLLHEDEVAPIFSQAYK